MTTRVNIGCGPMQPEGWLNVDRDPTLPSRQSSTGEGREVYTADISEPLRWFSTGSIDYAVAHHVLDMLDDIECVRALCNVCEVLKPDGVLRISTPDIVSGFDAWERGHAGWFPTEGSIDERFCAWLTWHGTRRSLWTFGRWSRGLRAAGFRDIRKCEAGETKLCDDPAICELDSRPGESLFIEAIK